MAVLVTAHEDCLNLNWEKLLSSMRRPLIYDGRRVLNLNELTSLGWETFAVGKPR
jgi:UDP-glucose 6-dehydrogenase